MMQQETAAIANITDQRWIAQRTYGNFIIEPAAPGAPCSVTRITARKGVIDLGDKRTLDFDIRARDIAEDLAREVNADAGENSFFGVFVCAGAAPTDEELAAARERLDDFYRRVVFAADQEWERTHNHLMITDVARRASRWLSLERDWAYDKRPVVECPACSEKLKAGVAVCRACGAILDREKAAQFGLAEKARLNHPGQLAPPVVDSKPREGKRA